MVGQHSPILHSGEGLLVGNVIHEQEAHGSTVVGCGDGPVALLACCVLGKQRSVSWGSPAPYLTLQGPERDTGLSLWSNLMGRHGPALSALAAHPGMTHYRLYHQPLCPVLRTLLTDSALPWMGSSVQGWMTSSYL